MFAHCNLELKLTDKGDTTKLVEVCESWKAVMELIQSQNFTAVQSKLCDSIERWKLAWGSVFPMHKVGGYYIHIIAVHAVSMQNRLAEYNIAIGCLSQEGFEVANKEHWSRSYSCTSHNGGGGKSRRSTTCTALTLH